MKGKDIRTKYLEYTENITDAASHYLNAMTTWLVQDRIRIIGVQLEMGWHFVGAISQGQGGGRMHVDVSRVGVENQDGVLLGAHSVLAGAVETGGISMTGKLWDHVMAMFPEGFGIDMDPGEYLYLNGSYRLDAIDGGTISFGTHCIVYYVER